MPRLRRRRCRTCRAGVGVDGWADSPRRPAPRGRSDSGPAPPPTSRSLRRPPPRARRTRSTMRASAGSRGASPETPPCPGSDRGRRSQQRRARPCEYPRRREPCTRHQTARSWSCHSFHQPGWMARTAGRADRTVIGPFAQAPLRSRSPNRCVRRTGPRSPGRLITSKAPTGRPICGSDRVSETLHAPYQREEHAARIITDDLRLSKKGRPIRRSVAGVAHAVPLTRQGGKDFLLVIRQEGE